MSAPDRVDLRFAVDQPWVRTGRTLTFVDETRDIVATNESVPAGYLDAVDDEDEDDLGHDHGHGQANRGLGRNSSCPGGQLSPHSPSAAVDAALCTPLLAYSQPSATSPLARSETHIALPERHLGPRLPSEEEGSTSNLATTDGTSNPSPGNPASYSRGGQIAPIQGMWDDVYTTTSPFAFPRDQPIVAAQADVLYEDRAATELAYNDGPPSSTYRPANSVGTQLSLSPSSPSSIYLHTPQWPLQDSQQAFLFRHYVENIASFLDLCDQGRRHFATVVPQRAAVCMLLFNAILAASAKRLSRISDLDALVVDKYHQICIRLLIPSLSISDAVADENVLTAIVLLRFMEELDVPVSPPGPESHLMGTRVFLGSQKAGTACEFTGLRLAAFWVALRQEIYMAFVHARPVHANFALDDMCRLIEEDENGCGYANRIIIHCAKCLRHCYGLEAQNVGAWEELKAYQERWWSEAPWYFQPLWADSESETFFPREMYLNDAVVTGLQHYHLARILLTAHNPTIPKLGPGQVKAATAMSEEIKQVVRVICGIAEVGSPFAITGP